MGGYEVLAPVGRFNELDIILSEEPDAVYVGFKGLTSRPSRTDFTVGEIEKAVELCHARGVNIYVAINSGVRSDEFDNLIENIRRLDEAGADGFIVADYGLISVLSGMGLKGQIHASTLLGVYNVETVGILRDMGVARIIFYANMYLDEMMQIMNAYPNLDYELVAEGGTCFNDIRQCRLPHLISETEHTLTCRSGCFILKDEEWVKGKMLAEPPCKVSGIAGLFMAAGIKSFKIEGRTVPAAERIQCIRDLKTAINHFEKESSLEGYLHYISRMRRKALR